eukprot:gene44089-54789_t
MTKKIGNSAKDSGYLKRLKDAIAHDKDHPRNNGVRMQAHHIISGDGMKRSKMGKKIEQFGVQPHRGNHDFSMEQDDYQDDLEPRGYHELVASKLRRLEFPIDKECDTETANDRAKVVEALDALSKNILNLIQFKPAEAPLTKLASHFGAGAVGCGGVDSITKHMPTRPCPVDRKHKVQAGHPKLSHGPLQAKPDENTEDRRFRFEMQQPGSAPLVFHNTWKEENLRKGIRSLSPAVLFEGDDLVVSTAIRQSLLLADIPDLAMHPVVYIDDQGEWHEDYWFLTFTKWLDCWDRNASTYEQDDPPVRLGGFELYQEDRWMGSLFAIEVWRASLEVMAKAAL